MGKFFGSILLLRPVYVFLVLLTLALVMVSSAVIEISQSRDELLALMKNQSHNHMETLFRASRNSLLASEFIEDLLKERLFNNAYFVRQLYEDGNVDNQRLKQISDENNIHRIHIFDRRGNKIFSSHQRRHYGVIEKFSPADSLRPIFDNYSDTLVLGLRKARFQKGARFTVALAAKDRAAIVLNVDAAGLTDFRRKIGFGVLLRDVTQHPGIVYAALQDSGGILAASGNVQSLENLADSPFLIKSLRDSTFETRLSNFGSVQVFEAVHPFTYQQQVVGLFRLGFSLEALETINARIYRRIIVITLVLIAISSLFTILILMRQSLDNMRKSYQEVETYSANIIRHVSDSVVIIDSQKRILIFNTAAEKLFQRRQDEVLSQPLTSLLQKEQCQDIFQSGQELRRFWCRINEKAKLLLISKTTFTDKEQNENIILVVRDLTDQKILEDQLQRQERLSAMGELASGVAHEIRNPLNTIGTIAQQLDKDFEAFEHNSEFHQLAKLVYREVKRINQTVEDFLHFARPLPIHPETFKLSELIEQLANQYQPLFDSHQLTFDHQLLWDGDVDWDRNQIQQALMNLIQNAIDVLLPGGRIHLMVRANNPSSIEIQLSDNGPGIPKDIRQKIFNLYFTTKPTGTGIGLGITQRVVDQHHGTISVESEMEHGTTITIRLPRQIQIAPVLEELGP